MPAILSGESSKERTQSYENPEPGSYPARCFAVIELGSQPNFYYDEKVEGSKKYQKKVKLFFELNELMQDGRPFVVSKDFTASLHEKAELRKTLVKWRKKEFTDDELKKFSLSKILDAPCMVEIALSKPDKNGKQWTNVIAVGSLMKGITLPERHNDLIDFGISDIGSDVYNKLYPYVQKMILNSVEGKIWIEESAKTPAIPYDEDQGQMDFVDDDSIPF